MTEPSTREPSTRRCCVCTKPREVHVGLLCVAHHQRLADMLRDVEEQATYLDARPSMAIRSGSGGGSLASTRAPARLDVLVHTDRRRGTGKSETEDDALAAGKTLPVLDVLHSWARTVREDRMIDSPTRWIVTGRLATSRLIGPACADACRHGSCIEMTRRKLIPADPTITGERDLLTRQLDWLAAQPYVDECYNDVRQVLGQLKAANGTQDEKPVGRCYLPNDTGVCDGPIWTDDAAGHAHCGRCFSTWDGAQLGLLAYELEQARQEAARPKTDDGRRMLTAQELVAQGHVSTLSNVRVRVHRLGIVSVDGHYDPDDFRDRMTA